MMRYEGYLGAIEVDEEDGILFGRTVGLRDVITFQGGTVAEAHKAFQDSVDYYLDLCARGGKSPEKLFSGRFVVRLRPETHRALVQTIEAQRISLNALVEKILRKSVSPAAPPAPRPTVSQRPAAVGGPLPGGR
jgi:predicted HicB family RNase H-like nuclease